LGTPVPKVLSWSSNATDNPFDAEYIIMEKVPGIQPDEVWPSMHIKDKFELVKSISGYQKAYCLNKDGLKFWEHESQYCYSLSDIVIHTLTKLADRGPCINMLYANTS
jgi:hypothetical protein